MSLESDPSPRASEPKRARLLAPSRRSSSACSSSVARMLVRLRLGSSTFAILRPALGHGESTYRNACLTTALLTGIEWNYRVVAKIETAAFREIRTAFDSLFDHPATRELTWAWIDAYRQRRPIHSTHSGTWATTVSGSRQARRCFARLSRASVATASPAVSAGKSSAQPRSWEFLPRHR